jgi:hypothetical protein
VPNFYYVKLSCPAEIKGNFLNIVANSIEKVAFEETLSNIPNKLTEAVNGDFVILQLGGDNAKKKSFFSSYPEYREFQNGWYAIGIINRIVASKNEFSAKFYPFEECVTKLDLYPYPQFIDNIGCITKGVPNQAGLFGIDNDVALSFVEYLLINNLAGIAREVLEPVNQRNTLEESSRGFYKANSKLVQMNSYPIVSNDMERALQSKSVAMSQSYLNEFVEWFIKKDNRDERKYYSKYFRASEDNLRKKLSEYEGIYYDQFGSAIFTTKDENIPKLIENLEINLYKEKGEFFDLSASVNNHMPRAVLGKRNYILFLKEYALSKNKTLQTDFNWWSFDAVVEESGLILSQQLTQRFVASLQTKPFVILTGLSGSGKTKLAEAYSSWICEFDKQVCMVAVGADWTNRESLLGYPNALASGSYVKPDSKILDLILNAENDLENPYFLILDEMNMSHVERYFADFLSAMESVNSTISLHSGDKEWNGVPSQVTLPKNLFIIGTVNVDETTYMFSPKVLDRANVIEFRVKYSEMDDYLNSSINLDMKNLNGKGAHMAQDFVSIALGETGKVEGLSDKLMPFFDNLQTVGAEFGYRSASEISRFVGIYNSMTGIIEEHDAIDAAIAQKLLPKLHGSRNKLQRILVILAKQCLYDTSREDAFKDVSEDDIKYPISYEKLKRMHERIMADGFTSFAEA